MKPIVLIQENWLTIVLVITAIIVVLKAIANLRIRLAKITPDKSDDERAKMFSKYIDAIIAFFKDIFRLNKKDKKEGGFIQVSLQLSIALFLAGIVLGAFLLHKLRKPDIKEVQVPQFIEVHSKSNVDQSKKKGSTSIERHFDCQDGSLSKELIKEDVEEKKDISSADSSLNISEPAAENRLDVLLGLGGSLRTGDKLRDIKEFKPQLAAGAIYGDDKEGQGGLLSSDGDKNHSVFYFYRRSIK